MKRYVTCTPRVTRGVFYCFHVPASGHNRAIMRIPCLQILPAGRACRCRLILSALPSRKIRKRPSPAQLPSGPNVTPFDSRSAKATDEDYTKQAYVYELYQEKTRFEADGTGEEATTVRVRVQSDAALKGWGQLVFGYNSESEELKVNYARVKKPDGKVIETPLDSIRDMTSAVEREAPVYTDYREKHMTVSALQVGDILEYQRVRKIVKPATPNQFWSEHSFIKNYIVLDEETGVQHSRRRATQS